MLGDSVNTAQRLENSAGQTQVLVSALATLGRRWPGTAVFCFMPPLQVKNKAEPLKVYSVRGLKILNGRGDAASR